MIKYFLLFILQVASIVCELKFVCEVFRHGSRSPWAPGNTGINATKQDIFGEYWPNSLPGLEPDLTAMGIRQQYLLGYKMKTKYVDTGFLDKNYNASQLLVYSTNVNRTIMSAQSQLFGIYPPGTGPQILKSQSQIAIPPGTPIPDLDRIIAELGVNSLPYASQIFPVHLFEEKYESLHMPNKCPPADKIETANEKKVEIIEFVKKFNDSYFDKLQQVIKFKENNYLTILNNLLVITDTFIANYFEGRQLLSLVNAGIDLKEFYNQSITYLELFSIKIFGDQDCYISKIASSRVFRELIDNMDWVVSMENKGADADWTKRQKFLMLSMHDTSIFGYLTFLNYCLKTGNVNYPVFASNLIFEFEKTTAKIKDFNNTDFTLKIIYNDKEIYQKTYDEFRNLVYKQLLTTEEIDEFCNLFPTANHLAYMIVIIILGLIIIIQIIVIVIVVRKKNHGVVYDEM